MEQPKADHCVLYKQKGNVLEAMVILKNDNSIIVASEEFLEVEDDRPKQFRRKARKVLEQLPTIFNSIEFSLRPNGSIKMTQRKKLENLVTPTTENGFCSERALV